MRMKNTQVIDMSITALNEGLRPNDLVGMVSNEVSVDEYQSKIDDTAVVIAFSVNDRNGAKDLNRYIQKSFIDLLDTEVSSAPDQTGSYYVFVELQMNQKLAEYVGSLCDDLYPLTGIREWTLKVRGMDTVENCTPEQITEIITAKTTQDMNECFNDLRVSRGDKKSFIVESDMSSIAFDLYDYGSGAQVVKRNELMEKGYDITPQGYSTYRRIKSVLGPSWGVDVLQECVVLHQTTSDKMLVIKLR